MFFKNLKLKPKLLALGLALTLWPLLVFGAIVSFQNSNAGKISRTETIKMARNQLDHIAAGVRAMMAAENEMLQRSFNSYMALFLKEADTGGGIQVGYEKVVWQAINQNDESVQSVTLPKITVAGQWPGQVTAMETPVPVVDGVRDYYQDYTMTLLQRMNLAGDLLRIASSVSHTDGLRATRTYIPAIGRDGA
ncbi:MAG: hypothetical protein HKP58_14000, partial [Desulfatitalea sp.]|nr:Cache 3/Cache 2 fusion domain-containing protein [Desulfatitalea sp.]NNK01516.1 hypothetical protein [Desulfatitalea sp.]